jgi:hypothetical protein
MNSGSYFTCAAYKLKWGVLFYVSTHLTGLNALPLDLFGFEKYTFLAGSGRSLLAFSTRLRVLQLKTRLVFLCFVKFPACFW